MKKINIAIPDEDHRTLKLTAVKTDKTMTEIVLTAIRDWLRKAT